MDFSKLIWCDRKKRVTFEIGALNNHKIKVSIFNPVLFDNKNATHKSEGK